MRGKGRISNEGKRQCWHRCFVTSCVPSRTCMPSRLRACDYFCVILLPGHLHIFDYYCVVLLHMHACVILLTQHCSPSMYFFCAATSPLS